MCTVYTVGGVISRFSPHFPYTRYQACTLHYRMKVVSFWPSLLAATSSHMESRASTLTNQHDPVEGRGEQAGNGNGGGTHRYQTFQMRNRKGGGGGGLHK